MKTQQHHQQFASSIAPSIFSAEFCSDLDLICKQSSKQSRQYVLGALLFSASAAVHPDFVSGERRRASLARSATSAEATRGWADAGFFEPESGPASSVRCFHCGATFAFVVDQTEPVQLLQMHRRRSPGCELARLLDLVSGCRGPLPAPLPAEVAASAAKLLRAVAKLTADLRSSALLDRVESFGFGRREAAFCACREFMRSADGRMPSRPGDLMQVLHDSERLLAHLPCGTFSLEACLDQFNAEAAAREPAEAETAPYQPPQPESVCKEAAASEEARAAASQEPAPADDSDRCAVCGVQPREQVTLPCAHFVLCEKCARHRSLCPRCDSRILATVRAFIA